MRVTTVLFSLLALAAAGCGQQPSAPDGVSAWRDVQTPQQLESALADARGKPVILKVWAEW